MSAFIRVVQTLFSPLNVIKTLCGNKEDVWEQLVQTLSRKQERKLLFWQIREKGKGEMCRSLWPVRPEGCFHLALRSQLVLMSAIWETPERLHLFASWLGAPNPSSCPRLPLKLPHLLGWMERGKEGMGLRAVGRIAGGLGGVREEEQRCMHREQNRKKFQAQVHSPTVARPRSLWWLEPPRSLLFQYLLSCFLCTNPHLLSPRLC